MRAVLVRKVREFDADAHSDNATQELPWRKGDPITVTDFGIVHGGRIFLRGGPTLDVDRIFSDRSFVRLEVIA